MSSGPIHNLPTELLAIVFEYLAAAHHGKEGAWSYAMLVCRRWRFVGINTPSLWADIDCSSDQPPDLFLERSRGYPLSVYGDLTFDDDTCPNSKELERALRLLEPPYMTRLKDLRFSFAEEFDSNIIAPMIAKLSEQNIPTPQLEILCLSVYGLRIYPFTPAFLTSHSVWLDWIRLSGCFFPWGLGLPHLRYLDLILPYTDEPLSFPYQLQDVLDSLCNMPILEELSLEKSLPKVPGGRGLAAVQAHKAVLMKCLKSLSIEGDDDECFALWMLLDCPSLSCLNIIARKPTSSALVAQALRQPAHSNTHACYLLDMGPGSFTAGARIELRDLHDTAFPHIRFDVNIEPMYQLRVVSALIGHVDTLKLRGRRFWMPDYEEAVAFFTLAQRLRRILISGPSAFRPFLSVLSTAHLQNQTPSSTTLSFPSLAAVEINAVDFEAKMDVGQDPDCLLGVLFSSALQSRKDAGQQLSSLRIIGCEGDVSSLESWHGVVEEFKCIS